jgi:hypothetical protein
MVGGAVLRCGIIVWSDSVLRLPLLLCRYAAFGVVGLDVEN